MILIKHQPEAIRNLAYLRCKEQNNHNRWDEDKCCSSLFTWYKTKEGLDYWRHLNKNVATQYYIDIAIKALGLNNTDLLPLIFN